MSKRRLIDCQYFEKQDIAVIHEIVDNERQYQIFKNPDFSYYIEPNLKQKKKETKYYKHINELRRVDCKYADRYKSMIKELGVTNISSDELERSYQLRKQLCADHNLYGSDDAIEFRLLRDYTEKYKDELDDSMPIHYMFFDIETHSDFDKNVYVCLKDIYNNLESGDIKPLDVSEIYLEPYKNIIECTDIDEFIGYLHNYSERFQKHKYRDARVFIAIYQSKMMSLNQERCVNYLNKCITKEFLDSYYDDIGFPDENKANNRIDAISFVDTYNRKLYMYILNVPEDLKKEDEREYVLDENYVQNDLFEFLQLFTLTSYLKNASKADKKRYEDIVKDLEFLDTKYEDYKACTDEDKIKIKEIVEKAKAIIPSFDNEIKIEVEYKVFDFELDMLKSFFSVTKNVIKPNIIAAHNARFDILTMKGRLAKFDESFDQEINQFDCFYDVYPELKEIVPYMKIDMLTMEKKKEKTRYDFPGLVTADTLLLYAKTVSKEKDWSLNSIANEELNDHKVDYDFDITEFYSRDIRTFIKYSAVDTMLLMRLEEKLQFISLYQLILSNSRSPWSQLVYRTAFIANMFRYELWTQESGPYAMRNNLCIPDHSKSSEESSGTAFQGAYNTALDSACDSYGYHQNLFDLDFSAFYPNCAITTGIAVDQIVFFTDDKEMHNDYMFCTKLDFGNKYFNLPSSIDILNDDDF